MATISVIYPREEGAEFDFDYYEDVHLPLIAERWRGAGFVGSEALRGTGTPDGGAAPFLAIAIIHFASAEALRAALTGEHAAEIIGDIANFTRVRPILQLNERIPAPAA
jgi:uncharacterized protein (TIGR02118 family)